MLDVFKLLTPQNVAAIVARNYTPGWRVLAETAGFVIPPFRPRRVAEPSAASSRIEVVGLP